MEKLNMGELENLQGRTGLELLANPDGEPMNEYDRQFLAAMLAGAGYTQLRVVTNNHLTIRVSKMAKYRISRAWKERLFSWPWKPWVRMKEVEVEEFEARPDPNVYVDNGVIYCHPAIAAEVVQRTRAKFSGPCPAPQTMLKAHGA